MSTEKPTTKPEPIPVRLLRFRQATDIPGKSMANSVESSGHVEGKPYHQVEFLPWLRAFKIAFHPIETDNAGKRLPARTIMVHETWATWEPG